MELEEAYKNLYITQEEKKSLEMYTGFAHTRINILSDFSPENFNRLSKSWNLPQSEKELVACIKDFVNVYSVLYKEFKNLKERGIKSNTNLVRGTSNARVKNIGETVKQFLSTTIDEDIAKTFAEYGDGAIVHFNIASDVPFLDIENYKSEDRKDEKEVILAPFSKITSLSKKIEKNGFTHYYANVTRANLLEIPESELETLYSEIINGFEENTNDIKEYNYLQRKIESLPYAISREYDYKETEYLNKIKNESMDKCVELRKKTSEYKNKLTTLLKGLCRAREIETDKAIDTISKDKVEKQEKAKQERLKIENERLENKRIGIIAEVLAKLKKEPQTAQNIINYITATYNELKRQDKEYSSMAKELGVNYKTKINEETLNKIENIIKNITEIETLLQSVKVNKNDSLEQITLKEKSISSLLDRIEYSVELLGNTPNFTSIHSRQSENEIKKNIYLKAFDMIKNSKLGKLENERDYIKDEKVGFWGKLTGKDKLKELRLENNRLKLIEIREELPEEKQSYSIRDILAEMYAYKINEYNGTFPLEMQEFYNQIKEFFRNENRQKFSDSYIESLAMKKMANQPQSNLPVAYNTKGFSATKKQIESLKIENNSVAQRIRDNRQKNNSMGFYHIQPETDAVTIFNSKLKQVNAITRKDIGAGKNIDDTLELCYE